MHALQCPDFKGNHGVNRIPVFQTVSRTFGFIIGDIATILQVAWLPMLVVAALNFYVGGASMDEAIAAKGDPGISQMAGISYLVGFLGLLANVMILVALLRVVMYGQRPGAAPFYFWFGSTEGRLVLTYILLTIAAIAAVVGAGIVFGLIASASAGAAGSVVGLLTLVFVFVLFWVFLKLMIIPAVVVAEHNLGVERAWELMRGNALRMFAVLLMVYLPIGAAALALVSMILGADFPPLPDFQSLGASGNSEAVAGAMKTWQLEFLKAVRLNWVEFSVLNYISSIFSAALLAGIAGNAYMALAGEPAADGNA